MIIINLLSPNQKKELKIKRVYIAIKELVMLVLLFTSIIAIMLISSNYILDNRLGILIKKNAFSIQENKEVINKINLLNLKINAIHKIQSGFKEWSIFLLRLTELTPENISYDTVKINHDNSTIEIRGISKNRKDLINLKENLESSTLFENINLPLQNLLPKDNNQFTITANIILSEIK